MGYSISLMRGRTLVITLLGVFALHAEYTSYQSVHQVTGLLPDGQLSNGAPGKKYLERQIGRALNEDETSLLDFTADGKWKVFEDDVCRFEIPDHPLLKVSVSKPADNPHLAIVGGAVGDTDNRFDRVYQFTFGEDSIPYGMVFVSAQEWFDEGICFCGRIALKTFCAIDGNLLELSLLPNGNVKKFQAINGENRAILFEWTHSAITQEAYFRIGASLRLVNRSRKSKTAWKDYTQQYRKSNYASGWLRLGMPKAELIDLMGSPDFIGNNILRYEDAYRDEFGGGGRSIQKFTMQDGRLQRFLEDWSTSEPLEPIHGSRAWIGQALDGRRDPDNPFKRIESKISEEDLDYIYQLFRDEQKLDNFDYSYWSNTIAALAHKGYMKDEVGEYFRKRSIDHDLDHHQTRWILELYEYPEAEKFATDRLSYILTNDQAANNYHDEVWNLFSSVDLKSKGGKALLLRALSHTQDGIRSDAAYRIGALPEAEAKEVLNLLLRDDSKRVRSNAIHCIDDICDLSDKEWLNDCLKMEEEERNREEFTRKLENLN